MSTAYDNLCAAIRDYYQATEPEAYVDSWIIINHKRTLDLEARVEEVMKRGLLDVALTEDRFSTESGDEDD